MSVFVSNVAHLELIQSKHVTDQQPLKTEVDTFV